MGVSPRPLEPWLWKEERLSRCGPRAGCGRLVREAQVFSPSSQPWLQLRPGSVGLRAVLSVKAEGIMRMTGAPAELSDLPLPAHSSPSSWCPVLSRNPKWGLIFWPSLFSTGSSSYKHPWSVYSSLHSCHSSLEHDLPWPGHSPNPGQVSPTLPLQSVSVRSWPSPFEKPAGFLRHLEENQCLHDYQCLHYKPWHLYPSISSPSTIASTP